MKTRSSILISIIVALLLSASHVAAEPTAQQRAMAEALFNKGKEQMAAKNYDAACESFRESLRLDPDTATQFKLANCHERAGRTASAWSGYLEVVAMAKKEGRDDKVQAAQAEADRLKPKLSKLLIKVAPETKIDGMVIEIDGDPVGKAVWGTEIPFDPGKHTVQAKAPGHKLWTGSVTIPPDAGVGTVEIPALEIDPNAGKTNGSSTPKTSGGFSPWFWTGLAATVVGVGVAVGGGVWWGTAASSWNSTYEDNKKGWEGSGASSSEIEEYAEQRANEATGTIPPAGAIGMIVGGGIVAGVGIALLVVFSGTDDGEQASEAQLPPIMPQLAPGYAGVQVRF